MYYESFSCFIQCEEFYFEEMECMNYEEEEF